MASLQKRAIHAKYDLFTKKIDNCDAWKKSQNYAESAIKMKQTYKRLQERRMTDLGRADPMPACHGTSPSNTEEISGLVKALPLAIVFSAALWGIGALLLFEVMGG